MRTGTSHPFYSLRGLFLALGLVAFVCASAELAVRARLFFFDPHRWDRYGLFRYQASAQVGDSPTVTTNSDGFFGGELSKPKAPGVFRVFLLGSSPLTNPTAPQAMQEALSERFPGRRFEVNSTGIPRYTSYHNELLYEHYLSALEPDCIILYLGMNDNVYNTNPALTGPTPTGLWNWADPGRSIVLDMLWYHAVQKRFEVNPAFAEVRSGPILEQHLHAILESAQRHGVQAILVRMALGYPTGDPDLLGVINANERPMRHYWGDLTPAMRGFAANCEALEHLAREFSIPMADAGAVLPSTHAYFIDLCHLTPDGNRTLGRFFASLTGDAIAKAKVSSTRAE